MTNKVESMYTYFARTAKPTGLRALGGSARQVAADAHLARGTAPRDAAWLLHGAAAESMLLHVIAALAYKPVIMMHGVGSDAGEMNLIGKILAEDHPGTVATSLKVFENDASWMNPLQKQVPGIIDAVREIVASNSSLFGGGYHFVCKSQGALLCRFVLEEMNDHNVSTFISLAGPQVGVYGPGFFKGAPWPLPGLAVDEIWRVVYEPPLGESMQNHVSDANMWRDPKHLDEFVTSNPVLPLYNGHASDAAIARYKANFVRLKSAVFCVGSGNEFDGGISPWQTGVWGSMDAAGRMVNMTEQRFYVNDTFGLRTLNESGRLLFTIIPGASHGDWTGDADLIRRAVVPRLD